MIKKAIQAILFLFLFAPSLFAASNATLSLKYDGLSEPSNFQPDTAFTYKLEVTDPTEEVLAVKVTLTFNKDYIRVVDSNGTEVSSVPAGDFLAPFANCALGTCLPNTIDNATGTLTVGAFWDPDQQGTAPSAPVSAFKLNFKGVQGTGSTTDAGTIFLNIDTSELSTFDGAQVLDYPADGTLNGQSTGNVSLKSFVIAPVAPTGLAWTNQDNSANSSIKLSWTANPEQSDPANSVTYNVFRTDVSPSVPIATTAAGVTNYEDTTIDWKSSSTTFEYKVSATISTLEGPQSTGLTVGPDAWAPQPDQNSVTVTRVTDRSCSIQWQNDENQVKASIIYDTVQGNVDNGTTTSDKSGAVGSPTSSVTVTGLSPTTTYYYKVRAKDRAGNTLGYVGDDGTPTGNPFSCTTSDKPPTVPSLSNVQCTADTTNKKITVTWDSSVDADSKVCLTSDSTTSKDCATYLTNGFSLSDPSMLSAGHSLEFADGAQDENAASISLQIGTSYSVLVISDSLPGDTTACNNNPCQGTKTLSCQYGEALAVTVGPSASTTTTSATITWTTNKASTSKVLYGTSSGTLDQSATASPDDPVTSHSVTLNGLAEDTTYFYQVESTAGTETVTAPTTPSQFKTQKSVTPKGNVTVTVKDTAGSAISGATVELRDTGGTLKKSGTTGATGIAQLQSVDVGGYTVSATKTSFSSDSASIQVSEGQTTTVDLTLQEIKSLGDLEITALNAKDDSALADVLITLDPSNADPSTTGTDGKVLFDNLPAEVSYTITATKDGFFDATASTSGPLLGDNNGTIVTPITIKLQEAATIKGTVVQKSGTSEVPLSGISVYPDGTTISNKCDFVASSDSNGEFAVNVAEGSYTIKVLDKNLTCGDTLYAGAQDRGFNVPPSINVGQVSPGQIVTKDTSGNDIKFTLDPRYIITITPADASVALTATVFLQAEITQGGRAPNPPISSLKWAHSNAQVGSFLDADGSTQDTVTVTNPGSKPTITFVIEDTGTTDITIEEINGNTESTPLINSGIPVRITVASQLAISSVSFATPDGLPLGDKPLNPNTESTINVTYSLSQQSPKPEVKVRIFKFDGALIRELNGSEKAATWDFKDAAGNLVPNGVYLVQIVAENISGKITSPIKLMGIFR